MPSISITNPEVITSIRLGTASPKLGGTVDLNNFKVVSVFNGSSQDLAGFQNYSHITSFTNVDLSSNKLTGDAPDFSTSSNCQIINLNNNELNGVIPTILPSGIQVFRATNNNFATIDTSGTVYSTTIATSSGTLNGGAVFTKTDEETFTVVNSSGTSADGFINFINTSTSGFQVGKYRMTFDAVVSSTAGSEQKITVIYRDNDADATNGNSEVEFKIQSGSNVFDFEIFNDGDADTPEIKWKVGSGSTLLNLSVTNFKIIRDPVGFGNVGLTDISTYTSLAEFNIKDQTDKFGAVDSNGDVEINAVGHATNANKVLNYSGPSELSNSSIDAGSIEGAIPESIRIINLRHTNISKNSKRILLTQLYDTFNGKGTNYAKTTAVNGVTYSTPLIDVKNDRGTWNAAAGSAGSLAAHQKLIGKHVGVTIKEAKDELNDVGFTLLGF